MVEFNSSSSAELLRLEQVSLDSAIGSQPILQDLNGVVAVGDRLAIVGPSGAGKTTLLRLLNRLAEPSAGVIYFEGIDIRQIPVLQLRQHITLVLQESKLLGMTVREALSYPLKLRGLSQSTIQQRLGTYLDLVHLPTEWLDRTEVQLSVGQRQLVAIARAVMIQPKVLLLDEPTSALDAGRGAYITEVLSRLTDHYQTTIVMVNHQLEIAQQFGTKVWYLQDGKLLTTAAAQDVDWDELKERFTRAEARQQEEWT
jgi:D-methionine transport system ATP-binding protein